MSDRVQQSSTAGAAEPAGLPGTHDPGKESRARAGIPVVPSMDGFRAFAILGIVLLHLISAVIQPRGEFARTLTYGTLPYFVEVLFILSGFVVFLPTVARAGDFGDLRGYAIRRAARLLPAYWASILIVLVLLMLWPGVDPRWPTSTEIGLQTLALHQPAAMLDPDFVQGLGINGPLWTLSIEVTFYLLLPLIAGLYFRHPIAGLFIAVAITVAWKLGAENVGAISRALGLDLDGPRVLSLSLSAQSQFPAFAFNFAAGMTAAWAFVRLRDRAASAELRRAAVLVQLAATAALVVLVAAFGTGERVDAPLINPFTRADIPLSLAIGTALAAFMLATSLAPPRAQRPFSLPFARSLGDISYGVYLIHFPLILFVGTAIVAWDLPDVLSEFWLFAPVLLAAALLYGWLSARFLELPIRRWAHRFGRRAQPGPGRLPGAATRVAQTPTDAG